MSFEVHLYAAVAMAESAESHAAGQRHPMLVFLRQPVGTEHDLPAAAAVAESAGWVEVDFTKAGVLPAEAEPTMDEGFRTHYLAALDAGHSLLVYDSVVRPAPQK